MPHTRAGSHATGSHATGSHATGSHASGNGLRLLVPLLLPLLCVTSCLFHDSESGGGGPAVLEPPWVERFTWNDSLLGFGPPRDHLRVDWRRPIYRHSVVPGGVYDAEELRNASKRDPETARHYGVLRLGHLAPARLKEPGRFYLSYRRDGHIYWTSRPVEVPEGERVLTDGETLVRARCGNLMAPEPRMPVAPPSIEPEPTDFGPMPSNPVPQTSVVPVAPGVHTPTGDFLIPPVILWPGLWNGGGGGGSGPHHPPSPGDDPVVPVPEPATGALIMLGALLAGIGLYARR